MGEQRVSNAFARGHPLVVIRHGWKWLNAHPMPNSCRLLSRREEETQFRKRLRNNCISGTLPERQKKKANVLPCFCYRNFAKISFESDISLNYLYISIFLILSSLTEQRLSRSTEHARGKQADYQHSQKPFELWLIAGISVILFTLSCEAIFFIRKYCWNWIESLSFQCRCSELVRKSCLRPVLARSIFYFFVPLPGCARLACKRRHSLRIGYGEVHW